MFLLSLVFVNHSKVNSSHHSLNDVADLLCGALAIPFIFALICKMLDKRVLRIVVPVEQKSRDCEKCEVAGLGSRYAFVAGHRARTIAVKRRKRFGFAGGS